MPKLTTKEKKWLEKVQKVLNECPGERIAFFTTGDRGIHAFDATRYGEIDKYMNAHSTADFCISVREVGADFDEHLIFKNPVESTAG